MTTGREGRRGGGGFGACFGRSRSITQRVIPRQSLQRRGMVCTFLPSPNPLNLRLICCCFFFFPISDLPDPHYVLKAIKLTSPSPREVSEASIGAKKDSGGGRTRSGLKVKRESYADQSRDEDEQGRHAEPPLPKHEFGQTPNCMPKHDNLCKVKRGRSRSARTGYFKEPGGSRAAVRRKFIKGLKGSLRCP